jgi:uncharacterized protein
MDDIWRAARRGDLAEVERRAGQDPGLLNAKGADGWTPAMTASALGHVGVVRWLLDHGAAMDEKHEWRGTALCLACSYGRLPVVKLLLERGADPTIADRWGVTPLTAASSQGQLELVRLLLGNPSVKAVINQRAEGGATALWWACQNGRGGVVRALLQSGADPTIARFDGITPMAIAKEDRRFTSAGRRECVAALEVRLCQPSAAPCNR